MKAELRQLLSKLRQSPGFQSLVLCEDGRSLAVYASGVLPFANLAALEEWVYPGSNPHPAAPENVNNSP